MGSSHASYATLSNGRLVVSRNPIPTNDKICLKDVTYEIIEGVLYIKATEIEYYHISDLARDIFPDLFIASKNHAWVIKDKYKNKKHLFEEFPEEKEVRIPRLLMRDKVVMAYEISDDNANSKVWFKLKKEKSLVRAISDFHLIEDKLFE